MYEYNRRAFREVSKLQLQLPLVALYAAFVHLELVLKAFNPDLHHHRHDVCLMLEEFSSVIPLVTQLRNGMLTLRCRGLSGAAEHLEHHNYPALRYLRHESDHATDSDACDDDALRNLHGILDDILLQLRKNKRLKNFL